MDKLKMHSADKVQEHIAQIGRLFPNCITETMVDGKVVRVIDFDILRQELSDVVVEGPVERYQFTWPEKRKSVLAANAPIAATLRPCRAESVGADGTPGGFDSENLYIEGDNLDVLKLLQETYLGKIKMIYIDPPYNTGNDFVYEDDFAQEAGEYLSGSGQYDEQGNRLVQNTESNGRFHTDWLNMMYARMRLAKDLLSDDGVIFISLDNNENHNMRKIAEEIFGAQNFIGEIIVQNNPRGRQSDSFLATVHEYLICFAKNAAKCSVNGMPLSDEQKADYCFNDAHGAYRLLGLRQRGVASLREDRPDMFFPIYVNPDNLAVSLEKVDGWCEVIPKKSDGREGRWMWGKAKCKMDIARLVPKLIERRGEYDIFVKDYLEREGGTRTRKYKTIWDDKVINNQVGTQEVKELLGGDIMSFPKSRAFIQMICQMGSKKDSIVMDFFSGSSTTAQAVMQLNAEDGGHRKFIMVQIPEETAEKSAARKAGYPTICEIGKERIRRAGAKIKADSPLTTDGLDVGFRVLKLASGNMKDVYYSPAEYTMGSLFGMADNIKEDRTPEDLLFQVMLDLGIALSSKIEETTIAGKKVFSVADGYLIACFDDNVSTDTVKNIAQKQPYYAVFRDAGFGSDSTATNFEQIFETYSPSTTRKVL